MNVLVNLNLNGSEIQNVLLQNLAADPTAQGAGQVYYNTANNVIRYYTGSTWIDLAASSGGGTVDDIVAGAAINVTSSGNVFTIAHADTSTQANVTTTNAQVVNAITFDTYGHVVGITTRNLTLANIGFTGAADADKYTNWQIQANTGSPIDVTSLTQIKFDGSEGITTETGSGTPNLLKIGVDGTVVRTTGAQTIAGDKTFSNNITVNGNLTVSGAVNTVLSETVKIEDSLLLLNSNHTGTPTTDAGLIVERGTSQNVGLFWDESVDEWVFVNTNEDGTTNGNVTIASYANIRANRIKAALSAGGAGSFVVLTGGELLTRTANDIKGDLSARTFKQTIGNGSTTSFTITHSLSTTDVMVELFYLATGETVYADVTRSSVNAVQVTFRAAPATNAVRVLIKEI